MTRAPRRDRRTDERPECALCGSSITPLEAGLVEWIEPIPPAADGGVPTRFDSVSRCVDRAGCRGRVVDAGKPWPIVDGHRPSEHVDPPKLIPALDEPPLPPDPPVVENPVTGWHDYAPQDVDEELGLLDPARPW